MTRALAALALLASLATASAEPCAPRVRLSGDGGVVARVAVELAQLGVSLAEAPSTLSCSPTIAVVETDPGGISVAVQNAARRREGRVVSDARVAAAWIDSWVRDELEVASWAELRSEAAKPSAVAPTSSPPAAVRSSVAVDVSPARESVLDRYAASAGVVRSWTNDATTWDGFELSACARIGPACIGGRLRAVSQADTAYNATTADRSEVVALATASFAFALGQVRISPELGLGVGRVHTKRSDTCTSAPQPSPGDPDAPECDPTDPMCVMPPPTNECTVSASGEEFIGEDYEDTSYLPRAAAGVRVAFPIARGVWLDANASYALSPFAPRDATAETMTPTVAPVPLEPSSGYQLGIGVRVGLP